MLTRWKSDPLVQRMALGPDIEVTQENQEQDIAGAINSTDQLYLIIVRKADELPIGYIRIDWMDCHQTHAWLRFALGEARGQGYAREALGALLAGLFTRGLHRVEAEVYEFNHASLRLLQGLGFQQEGRKRQAHFDRQAYIDVIVLGLLESDWRH
jgi:RimJ/RimL family protein N-acetyltransferase